MTKPDFEAQAQQLAGELLDERMGRVIPIIVRALQAAHDVGDAAGYARGVEDSAKECERWAHIKNSGEGDFIYAQCAEYIRALTSKPSKETP